MRSNIRAVVDLDLLKGRNASPDTIATIKHEEPGGPKSISYASKPEGGFKSGSSFKAGQNLGEHIAGLNSEQKPYKIKLMTNHPHVQAALKAVPQQQGEPQHDHHARVLAHVIQTNHDRHFDHTHFLPGFHPEGHAGKAWSNKAQGGVGAAPQPTTGSVGGAAPSKPTPVKPIVRPAVTAAPNDFKDKVKENLAKIQSSKPGIRVTAKPSGSTEPSGIKKVTQPEAQPAASSPEKKVAPTYVPPPNKPIDGDDTASTYPIMTAIERGEWPHQDIDKRTGKKVHVFHPRNQTQLISELKGIVAKIIQDPKKGLKARYPQIKDDDFWDYLENSTGYGAAFDKVSTHTPGSGKAKGVPLRNQIWTHLVGQGAEATGGVMTREIHKYLKEQQEIDGAPAQLGKQSQKKDKNDPWGGKQNTARYRPNQDPRKLSLDGMVGGLPGARPRQHHGNPDNQRLVAATSAGKQLGSSPMQELGEGVDHYERLTGHNGRNPEAALKVLSHMSNSGILGDAVQSNTRAQAGTANPEKGEGKPKFVDENTPDHDQKDGSPGRLTVVRNHYTNELLPKMAEQAHPHEPGEPVPPAVRAARQKFITAHSLVSPEEHFDRIKEKFDAMRSAGHTEAIGVNPKNIEEMRRFVEKHHGPQGIPFDHSTFKAHHKEIEDKINAAPPDIAEAVRTSLGSIKQLQRGRSDMSAPRPGVPSTDRSVPTSPTPKKDDVARLEAEIREHHAAMRDPNTDASAKAAARAKYEAAQTKLRIAQKVTKEGPKGATPKEVVGKITEKFNENRAKHQRQMADTIHQDVENTLHPEDQHKASKGASAEDVRRSVFGKNPEIKPAVQKPKEIEPAERPTTGLGRIYAPGGEGKSGESATPRTKLRTREEKDRARLEQARVHGQPKLDRARQELKERLASSGDKKLKKLADSIGAVPTVKPAAMKKPAEPVEQKKIEEKPAPKKPKATQQPAAIQKVGTQATADTDALSALGAVDAAPAKPKGKKSEEKPTSKTGGLSLVAQIAKLGEGTTPAKAPEAKKPAAQPDQSKIEEKPKGNKPVGVVKVRKPEGKAATPAEQKKIEEKPKAPDAKAPEMPKQPVKEEAKKPAPEPAKASKTPAPAPAAPKAPEAKAEAQKPAPQPEAKIEKPATPTPVVDVKKLEAQAPKTEAGKKAKLTRREKRQAAREERKKAAGTAAMEARKKKVQEAKTEEDTLPEHDVDLSSPEPQFDIDEADTAPEAKTEENTVPEEDVDLSTPPEEKQAQRAPEQSTEERFAEKPGETDEERGRRLAAKADHISSKLGPPKEGDSGGFPTIDDLKREAAAETRNTAQTNGPPSRKDDAQTNARNMGAAAEGTPTRADRGQKATEADPFAAIGAKDAEPARPAAHENTHLHDALAQRFADVKAGKAEPPTAHEIKAMMEHVGAKHAPSADYKKIGETDKHEFHEHNDGHVKQIDKKTGATVDRFHPKSWASYYSQKHLGKQMGPNRQHLRPPKGSGFDYIGTRAGPMHNGKSQGRDYFRHKDGSVIAIHHDTKLSEIGRLTPQTWEKVKHQHLPHMFEAPTAAAAMKGKDGKAEFESITPPDDAFERETRPPPVEAPKAEEKPAPKEEESFDPIKGFKPENSLTPTGHKEPQFQGFTTRIVHPKNGAHTQTFTPDMVSRLWKKTQKHIEEHGDLTDDNILKVWGQEKEEHMKPFAANLLAEFRRAGVLAPAPVNTKGRVSAAEAKGSKPAVRARGAAKSEEPKTEAPKKSEEPKAEAPKEAPKDTRPPTERPGTEEYEWAQDIKSGKVDRGMGFHAWKKAKAAPKKEAVANDDESSGEDDMLPGGDDAVIERKPTGGKIGKSRPKVSVKKSVVHLGSLRMANEALEKSIYTKSSEAKEAEEKKPARMVKAAKEGIGKDGQKNYGYSETSKATATVRPDAGHPDPETFAQHLRTTTGVLSKIAKRYADGPAFAARMRQKIPNLLKKHKVSDQYLSGIYEALQKRA